MTPPSTRYFRFELAFDGVPQEVGFLTGVDDIGLDMKSENELLTPFENLPCPRVHTRCKFWFTESGLRRYADDLSAFAKRIRKENWDLIYAVFEASEEDLKQRVYHDRWQAAWSIEYKGAHAVFHEFGHIGAYAHKCCIYPRKTTKTLTTGG